MQQVIVADFLTRLQASGQLHNTVVLFTSDHAEQFYEHGSFSHIASLYEEEIRVPGFVLAGANALTTTEREHLIAARDRYTYHQDLHATILDLLGVLSERHRLPFAEYAAGRSLLRPLGVTEPVVILANHSDSCPEVSASFGAVQGPMKLQARAGEAFRCFDASSDPNERVKLGESQCPSVLHDAAYRAFPAFTKH
jgi:arylsulfatase A-like enzyme